MSRDPLDGLGDLAVKLQALTRDARIQQIRFIVEVTGLSWDYVRNLPEVERDALQAEYVGWLDRRAAINAAVTT